MKPLATKRGRGPKTALLPGGTLDQKDETVTAKTQSNQRNFQKASPSPSFCSASSISTAGVETSSGMSSTPTCGSSLTIEKGRPSTLSQPNDSRLRRTTAADPIEKKGPMTKLQALVLLAALAAATPVAARPIFATLYPGTSDTQRLQNAINDAVPGDTVYLANCSEGLSTEVLCWEPRTWVVDGSLTGKHGVTYDGFSGDQRSTLRLKNFEPHLGENWNNVRWNDILSISGDAVEQSTEIRGVIFDGNRDGQGFDHGDSPPPGCRGDCEPKQEGLVVYASPGRQQRVNVTSCDFVDHLWVGALAWHNVWLNATEVQTTGNHNALQLGGHDGTTVFTVSRWLSMNDRVGFRGEIEGRLGADDTVHGFISDSEVVDPTNVAISFGPKANEGVGSTFTIDRVRTYSRDNQDCNAHVWIVPRRAEIKITNSHIGSGDVRALRGLSLWLQQIGGPVSVYNVRFSGYVHIHSVAPKFDRRYPINFAHITVEGAGGDRFTAGALIGRRFAFYTNRNDRTIFPELHLRLSEITVTRRARADGIAHLHGGRLAIDRSFEHNRLPVVLIGSNVWGHSVLEAGGERHVVTRRFSWIDP